MFELVFLTGARAGQVIPVVKSLMAGRSPDCSLEVPDPNASRQHSRFVFDGKSLTVADNNSSNGTYVNDVRLVEPHLLVPDDVVRLGETRIRFQVSGRTADSSSIFGFKEEENDGGISQSILLSVADLSKQIKDPAQLAARLDAIIAVSRALVNIRDLEQVFDKILESLFAVFPQADRGFLMLGSLVEKLEPKAVRQRGKEMIEHLHVSTTICRQALEKKGAILFDDSKNADFDQGMSIVSLKIRSAMTVPLMIDDEVLGLLQIDTADRSRAFTADDLSLAVAVSQQAAIALHNAQLLEKVEKEAATKSNLMRFLPGPVVQQVLDGQLDLALGGRTCRGTILFSDVVGFTRMSETLHPEQVVALMNGYFSRMVPCIERGGGSVDKFMGDAIMAVWGVPLDKGDASRSGVEAGLAMQNALVGFNTLQKSASAPSLSMGIGLNTGMLVAGNIGYDNRIEYTVLGDTVNTAQRLESRANASQVLVTESTWIDLAGAGRGLAMPPLKVKNKVEALRTFSVRGLVVGNDEILLHLPVVCAGRPGCLIRRLHDQTFLLLHPADADITAGPLLTKVPEWPDADLGTAVVESLLPQQAVDGDWLRSQIRLPDSSLAGLLIVDAPPACLLQWEQMARGEDAH